MLYSVILSQTGRKSQYLFSIKGLCQAGNFEMQAKKNETKQDNDFSVPHLHLLINPLHKGLTGDTNKPEGTVDRLNRLKIF